jgi:hypothetical protein
MEIREGNDEESIRALLDHLNVCHDGYIRRLSFLKDRNYDAEGNVFYPSEGAEAGETIDSAECEVEAELLLNSYQDASIRQVVVLNFQQVRSFRFFQEPTFDYSEILEAAFQARGKKEFEFIFRIGPEARPRDMLHLVCRKVLCLELDR